MTHVNLTDNEWHKVQEFIVQDPHAYLGKDEAACRRFVEAVKWASRSGTMIYKRFVRWCENGAWERMLSFFADDPDMENGMIDSTIVRAHPCAAGAQKKR